MAHLGDGVNNKVFVEYEYNKGYHLYLINDNKKIIAPFDMKYPVDVVDFIINNKEKYNISLVELDFAKMFLEDIYYILMWQIRVRYKEELREWYKNLECRYLRVSSYWDIVLHYEYMHINDFEKILNKKGEDI